MRVLVLAPYAPSTTAAHGGARALAGFIGQLTRDHDVALVCLRAPHEPPVDPGIAARCTTVDVIARRELSASRPDRLRHRLRQLAAAGGRPSWVAAWRVEAAGATIERVAAAFRPEVVQFEMSVMAQYARHVPRNSATTVLVAHDPQLPASAERLREATGRARLAAWLDLRAWRRFEPRAYAAVDTVVAFSQRDREKIAAHSPTPVAVIPLGVEVPPAALNATGEPGTGLLFFGNYNHRPNLVGALSLIHEILPAVRLARPGTRATLVGPDPSPALRELAGDDTLVTGAVADVGPYLDAAEVVVAPLWTGGGTRVKVLEALAAGKALVATPTAVAGIKGLQPDRDVIVRDTTAGFAGAVVELLGDEERRAQFGAAARAWAEQHGGWRATVARFERVWRSGAEGLPP
jgi:polysaccharide biosynthesis protein PslH